MIHARKNVDERILESDDFRNRRPGYNTSIIQLKQAIEN